MNASELLATWQELVNLNAAELEVWLDTEESWSVGFKGYGEESVGHAAGRRTAELLADDPETWSADDWRHVRKSIGVIKRHRAQWPNGEVRDSRWRWALMNWGHDPLRDSSAGAGSPPQAP